MYDKCEKCSRYLKKNRSTCAIENFDNKWANLFKFRFNLIVKRIFNTKNFTRVYRTLIILACFSN